MNVDVEEIVGGAIQIPVISIRNDLRSLASLIIYIYSLLKTNRESYPRSNPAGLQTRLSHDEHFSHLFAVGRLPCIAILDEYNLIQAIYKAVISRRCS